MSKERSIYLSPKINTRFSQLRGDDLLELLTIVENFSFTYRKKLLFDEEVTFGTELEYEHASRHKITKFIHYNYPDWTSKTDGTCNFGGEISSRILTNTAEAWQELYNISSYLRKRRAKMYNNASSHVHVSRKPLEDLNYLRQFLKFIIAYEYVYFRFAYGELIIPRKKLFDFAKPISLKLYNNIDNINNSEACYLMIPSCDRNHSINFETKYETYEFRAFNGTKYAAIRQNEINFCINLFLAPSRGLIDEEFLDYRIKHNFISPITCIDMYSELCLKAALECADLIYDNNLDKVYFLKQYIKSFTGKEMVIQEKILRK